MKSIYKSNDDQNVLDFTAMKIFFSVIAILLSVTLPNALAITEKSVPYHSTALDQIMVDFKNQYPDFNWPIDANKANCNLQSGHSGLNQKFSVQRNSKFDLICPRPAPHIQPNES